MQFEAIHKEIQELIDASVFKGLLVPGAWIYSIKDNSLALAINPFFKKKESYSAKNRINAYFRLFEELQDKIFDKYGNIVWKNEYQVEFLKVFGEDMVIFW